jgi:hypothetical protein
MWHALDQDSQTPLVAAVHAGCLEVVAFLGAERNHMHYKVQWAAQHGHLQVSSQQQGGATLQLLPCRVAVNSGSSSGKCKLCGCNHAAE